MTRSRSSKCQIGSEQVDIQIEAIDKLFEKSKTGSKASKEQNQNEMIKATLLLVKNMSLQIKDLINENTSKDEKIDQLSKEVGELQNQVTDLEYENCKNTIRINGLLIHDDAKEGIESPEQSTEQFQNLLDNLGCVDVKLNDCWRIPNSNKNNAAKPPTLIAKFHNSNDKSYFLSHLYEIQNTNGFENLQICQQFPKSLKTRLQLLNKKAYEERKRGYRTSVRYIANNLQLYTKNSSQAWKLFKTT